VLVEVRRISAWIEGKKPHIAVRAVVDGVDGEWTMTFYREGGTNAVRGYTYACVKASGGRGEDGQEDCGAGEGADR
jgi:predicted signal transduction protein with EAL and GGDEF domain